MRWGLCVFVVTAVLSSCILTFGQANTGSTTTLVQKLSNNTSACSSSSDPGGNQPYCFAFFNGFTTNPNDLGVETLVPVSAAGHVSNVSIRQLMYPGWAGRVLCEYQPWFGASTHKSIGYSQNSAATVAAQDSFMLKVGCDVNLIDFYGSLDPAQTFNLGTTNAIFSDLSTRAGYPLKLGIMEDKNALTSSCSPSSQNEGATISCVENALMADMDYVNSHYANSGVYFTDGGNPVIFSFVTQSTWPVLTAADWNSIWSTLKSHTDAYAAPFKYIFEFGSFTSASWDSGRYAWMQPPRYSSSQQFWWGSVTSLSPTYLDTFYSAAIANPSQIAVGGLWKGFDDNNASWSGNRIIAEQCGQVWLQTAKEIARYFGGSNPQIPYVQVATWNDYEEGTAVEPGIDNCYTVNASISGTQLAWSLVASDAYASPATIHHFDVYYADAGGYLYSAATNVPATANTLDLSSLVPSGTWTVYVEMVGQALIINRMSSGVTFNNEQGAVSLSPTSLSFANQTVGTTSSTAKISVSNTGLTAMAIYGINITGDFAATNNCPASLAAGSACTVTVTFSPTASGARSGSLQVSDLAGSIPQVTTLSGSGVVPAISFTPAALSFSPQALGSTSSTQVVTLTNTGAGVLIVGGLAASGDYFVTNNSCSGTIAPSVSCTFTVAFTPSLAGARTGTVLVSSNAPGTNAIPLSGGGADFDISANPSAQAIPAGNSASFSLSVPSVGATFGNTISLSCGGLPANATCTFSASSLSADSSSMLTVTTKGAQSAASRSVATRRDYPLYATWLPSSFGFVGLTFATGLSRRKRQIKLAFMTVALLFLFGLASGCGGSQNSPAKSVVPGTPAGTYNLTVVASSGTLSHSTALVLAVK